MLLPSLWERVEQSWDHLVEEKPTNGVVFGPGGVLEVVQIKGPPQDSGEHLRPTALPSKTVLREVTMASDDMEAEFAGWRFGVLVQLRQAQGQLLGIGGLLSNVAELGEEVVPHSIPQRAPGVRLGHECWADSTDGSERFKLALRTCAAQDTRWG